MRFDSINNDGQLLDFMTDPSEELTGSLNRIDGDMLVLGGSGKMGKELVGLVRNGDIRNGKERLIHVASSFSNSEDSEIFRKMDVTCSAGDLADEAFLNSLPEAPLVIYMMGYKFGSGTNWRRSFHLNAIVPYLVGRKYAKSKIVVFSSGNPYPHSDMHGPGCRESTPLDPVGIYGWSIVARESAFATTAMNFPPQKLCFFRLMYAQHLNYGVLIDLARMIWNEEPVSLKMPAVNLVSQRDANEVAIRSLEHCSNPGFILNVAGPVVQVRDIVRKMAGIMDKKYYFTDEDNDQALIANDDLCQKIFGNYRDRVEEMILGASRWIMNNGSTWEKPTYFGRADHRY
jgi:nucleoside-diphosphate-sugar epimerase